MKRIRLTCRLLLIAMPLLASAQSFHWANSVSGYWHEFGTAVTTAPGGDLITCGTFYDQLVWNGDTLTGNGITDVHLASWTPAGELNWQRVLGASGWDFAGDVITSADGRILLTGKTEGVWQTDAGTLVSHAMFIASLTSDGQLLWLKTDTQGTGFGMGKSVAVSADGSRLFTGGYFLGDIEIDGNLLHNSAERMNGWVSCHDPAGNLLWLRHLNSTGSVEVRRLLVTTDGGLLVAGVCDADLEVDGQRYTGPGSGDIFLLQFNSEYELVRGRILGSVAGEELTGCVALPGGGIAITGESSAPWVTTEGIEVPTDAGFLLLLNEQLSVCGAGIVGSHVHLNDLALSVDDGLLACGRFEGTTPRGMTSVGDHDVWMGGFSLSDGNLVWEGQAGGIGYDSAFGITATSDGSAVITGHFEYHASFGTCSLDDMQDGYSDMFVSSFSPPLDPALANRTQQLGIAPNPANSGSVFSFYLTGSSPVRFRMFDISGRCVDHWQLTGITGWNHYRWQDKSRPSGLYLLQMQAGDVSGSGRLVLCK